MSSGRDPWIHIYALRCLNLSENERIANWRSSSSPTGNRWLGEGGSLRTDEPLIPSICFEFARVGGWMDGWSIGLWSLRSKKIREKLRCLLLLRIIFCYEVIVKLKKKKYSAILLLRGGGFIQRRLYSERLLTSTGVMTLQCIYTNGARRCSVYIQTGHLFTNPSCVIL